MSRTVGAFRRTISAAAMGLSASLLATCPAYAAGDPLHGTITDNGNGSATVSWTIDAGSTADVLVKFCATTATSTACKDDSNAYWASTNDGTEMQTSPKSFTEDSNVRIGMHMTSTVRPLPAGTYRIDMWDYTTTTLITSTTARIYKSSGGGGSSSASAAPTPEPLTLTLSAPGSRPECSNGRHTVAAGTWVGMPDSGSCTASATSPASGSRLLGWSTSAAFPVGVAQRQFDAGWGAIDGIYDGVRMIFIPAGASTFVTGSNTLYPIWSQP